MVVCENSINLKIMSTTLIDPKKIINIMFLSLSFLPSFPPLPSFPLLQPSNQNLKNQLIFKKKVAAPQDSIPLSLSLSLLY